MLFGTAVAERCMRESEAFGFDCDSPEQGEVHA